ncbi:MAG: 2,3-bisphosphoglycerate-independent phosphoglycerate mutase, partial [Patescibacteria group bacterium]
GKEPGNAILQAGMPYLDSLIAAYPSLSVAAAGLVVGLPWGQPGNSEVGHSAIGTGRIVIQDLAHINGEIRSGDFYKNPALLEAVEHAKKFDSALHLMGCTSPGGIHSHIDHLIALLELASRKGLKKIFLHFIADGQDAPPQDAINVLHTLEPYLKKAGARIASIQGRSYAMDRVLNWAVTEKVWHSAILGDGTATTDPAEYLKAAYADDVTDYALKPATVVEEGMPVGPVQDNDAFIFFDFRNDRVRQMASTLIYADSFKEFNPVRRPKNVKVVTMTKYAEEFTVPIAYPALDLPNTIGEVVSRAGWKQWRIAEKEKEAHVTNFFNGGRIKPFTGEQREIVSSRKMKGPEYIAHPEMSAQQVVDAVLQSAADETRLYIVNLANPDMIGHTGDLGATVKAMRVTDDCLKQMIEPLRARTDSAIIITADHGNAEELLDPLTKGEDTQHSTRNVPALFVAQGLEGAQDSGKSLESLAQEAPIGTLVDISPTALYFLGIDKPVEMTGSRLITVE